MEVQFWICPILEESIIIITKNGEEVVVNDEFKKKMGGLSSPLKLQYYCAGSIKIFENHACYTEGGVKFNLETFVPITDYRRFELLDGKLLPIAINSIRYDIVNKLLEYIEDNFEIPGRKCPNLCHIYYLPAGTTI